MKREEIRNSLENFFKKKSRHYLSAQLAIDIKELLKKEYPNREYGNHYLIDCRYEKDSFFGSENVIGSIKRCDPIEKNHVIDSVDFVIGKDLGISCFEKDGKMTLTLDINNLSKNDMIDIRNIGIHDHELIYFTFIRVKPENRGKLALLIPNCLSYFDKDIPPFAFYNYEGKFLHRSNKAIGDIGGGRGFGGFILEEGTVLEMPFPVISIGNNAFDGCKNLTEVYLSDHIFYIGKHAFANIPGLTIHCPMAKKPETWDEEWCDKSCRIIWEYK